jgi:hypothetical protein
LVGGVYNIFRGHAFHLNDCRVYWKVNKKAL